jgi:hypothetical protein
MKISEILFEAKIEDLDDVMDKPEDPDADKIPHILMQLRKAIDVDGNYPIMFKDGKKVKLNMDQIAGFIKKYLQSSPSEKEALQAQAANSLEGFMAALKKEFVKPNIPKIKGSRYMSHFGDEYPETPDEGPRTLDNMSDREEYSKARDTLKVDPSPEFTPTKAGKGGKHKTNWDKSDLPTKNKPEPKLIKKGLRR